jgi:signal transduction histidine kinase
MVPPEQIETYYNAFREISSIVHSSTEVNEVLELVVWKATDALGAKGSLLRILNLESGEFELNASYGLSREYLAKGPITEKALITDLYKKNRVIIINDIQKDPRVQYPEAAAEEGIQTILDVPLKFQKETFGILRIFFSNLRTFLKDELNFLVSISEQCACAIDKARFIEDQRNKYDHLALQTEKLSALGRMAAGIAHEINNPLAGILLYSSNLYKKASDNEPFKDGLGIIIRETQRCKVIIQDLLEFSREKEPNKTMAHINQIIEKSFRILENEFRLRHIEMILKLSPEIERSLLDENQMQQVFVNLLLNATQAIHENGSITIESLANAAREKIIVRISDTGPGIPLQHLGKIFDPFFSTKKDGSGLGLAVSYGIIRNHQGSLNVENLPGKGCRFTIALPLTKEKLKRGI